MRDMILLALVAFTVYGAGWLNGADVFPGIFRYVVAGAVGILVSQTLQLRKDVPA